MRIEWFDKKENKWKLLVKSTGKPTVVIQSRVHYRIR